MPRSKRAHPTPTVTVKKPKPPKYGESPARVAHKSTPKGDEESLAGDVDSEIPDEFSDSDEYQAPSDVNDESDHLSTSKSSRSFHLPADFDSDALDEEDQDIGLNYHANSPGKKGAPHKKAASQSPVPVTPSKSTVNLRWSSATPSKQVNKATPSKLASARKRKRTNNDEGRESTGFSEEIDQGVPIKTKKLSSDHVNPSKLNANLKRSGATPSKGSSAKKATPKKSKSIMKRKRADDNESEESVGRSEEFDEGIIVVGKVIEAPTTGRGKLVTSAFTLRICNLSSKSPMVAYPETPLISLLILWTRRATIGSGSDCTVGIEHLGDDDG